MILSKEITNSIDKSVLCWLATVSLDQEPNVSPKEIFTYYGEDKIIIANIASPQSARNIHQNPRVCVSFVDILVQKGFKLKGNARVVRKQELDFSEMEKVLTKMTGGNYPFATIIEISIDQVTPIVAPSYVLFPEKTVEERVESARRAYRL